MASNQTHTLPTSVTEFYNELRGKSISLHLISGKEIRGRLERVVEDGLVVQYANALALVHLHGIALAYEVKQS
jgi:hypothetical protein